MSFEHLNAVLDPKYDRLSTETYAKRLREKFATAAGDIRIEPGSEQKIESNPQAEEKSTGIDMLQAVTQVAIQTVKNDAEFFQRLSTEGMHWRGVVQKIEEALPDVLDQQEKNRLAYSLVPTVLNNLLGEQNIGWKNESRPSRGSEKKPVTWIVPILKNDAH